MLTNRPISLILAAALLIVIGVSGMAAGGGLLGVALNSDPPTTGVRQAGLGLGAVIAAYGFAAVLAGAALLLFRRWAWRLGLFTIVIGLVGLGGALAASGTADPILLVGAVLWATALACLLATPTRAALQS